VPLISLIIPTKDEANAVCECIQRASKAFDEIGIEGEVIVADSSTDGTADMASSCGAKVVKPEKLGYGNAYLEGFKHARGRYIVLMDGDLTYDPGEMRGMLTLLLSGECDMVIGSRLKGRIEPGAMPALHRYIGNPFLTWLLNRLFYTGISDAHCGMRAITRESLDKLTLKAGGMEFASEMVIEASRKGLRISEVPITYHPRKGESKLSSFSDGWRHIRFMMLYRPVPFLLIPGGVALALGLSLAAGVLMRGGSRMHSLILGSLLLIIGYQMLFAGFFFGAFGEAYGVAGRSKVIKKLMSYHSLERELIVGIILLLFGVVLGIDVILNWRASGFGSLDAVQSAMMAMILSILGIQTIFSGLFISLLLLGSGQQD